MDTIPQDAPQDKPVYIYTLASPAVPEKIRYVGKTTCPKTRLAQHIRDKSSTYRGNWLSSLRSQGLVPIMTIVEETMPDKWKEREVFWVAFYRSQGHDLVNATEGGDGHEHTPESLAKIAASKKGKKREPYSEEWRRNISSARMGKKHAPETIVKISTAHEGKKRPPRSEEWQQKLNVAHIGRKNTPETIARMSASAKKRDPRTFTEEARRNISNAQRGRIQSPETREKIAASKRGKKASPEARANMSLGRKRAKAMRENPPDAPKMLS